MNITKAYAGLTGALRGNAEFAENWRRNFEHIIEDALREEIPGWLHRNVQLRVARAVAERIMNRAFNVRVNDV